ncbi:multicopper oxidase domain-containing protein [Acidobacteria bacterium AH-259-L09]|nr:multicopper oxidase domain-containing protein [Acidobacteria bacterium AH-259-L09]
MKKKFSRRRMIGGAVGAAGLAGSRALVGVSSSSPDRSIPAAHDATVMSTPGEVDLSEFDPSKFLYEFDYGKLTQLPDGRTLREWEIMAIDKEIEIAPGVYFPAWTYNGQVPGPTLRCTEGDRLRIHFANGGSHPHTIHFHGFHPAKMDGVLEVIKPGDEYLYEFDAEPFGLHLYHCHSVPLKRHIHKGLYGAFIVDPPKKRRPAREMVLVMNGFDTNFDGENEVYGVNSVAFHYHRHPIEVKLQELVRIYLVNILEFDLVNSLHIHGHFFDVYRTGTKPTPTEFTDTIMMCQGERHLLELKFRHPGKFMFHAHQSEFAELGWMGFFQVKA